MPYMKFKYDYCKEPRKQITTTINGKILDELTKFSLQIGQPKTKILDLMIKTIIEDEDNLGEFIQKVKEY